MNEVNWLAPIEVDDLKDQEHEDWCWMKFIIIGRIKAVQESLCKRIVELIAAIPDRDETK